MSALSFKDQAECLQAIGAALVSAMREPWQEIVVSVELDGVEVTLIKRYKDIQGQSRDVPFIPMLGECFYRLARLISTEEKGLYKSCKFTLHANGRYETEYEYAA